MNKLVEKYDMKKNVWERKDIDPMKESQKKAFRNIWLFIVVVLFTGSFMFLLAYLFPHAALIFGVLGLVFIIFGLFGIFMRNKLSKRIKKYEKMWTENPSLNSIWKDYMDKGCVKYESHIKIKDATESDMNRISDCIKEKLYGIEDIYTFRTVIEENLDVNILTVRGVSMKYCILYDEHSPFHITMGVMSVPGAENKIFSLSIAVKSSEEKRMKEKIEKIKDISRNCVLKNFNSID